MKREREGKRERERQREAERDRDRDRDRQTERGKMLKISVFCINLQLICHYILFLSIFDVKI